MSSWLFRYILVDAHALLLVAPDMHGSLSHGVVTQAVPLKHIASLEASPHNPNLLQVEIKDILDTAAAAAAVRI